MSSLAYDLASDAIAPNARSPAPRKVNKKAASRRTPPSLGGKRHAAEWRGAIRRAQHIGCNLAKSRVTVAHIYSTTNADFIKMAQQIGRILIDAGSAGSF